jgi:glyoxylase-like metal-dependent hydrolase (beta-lactamase superfamily II)
VIYPEASPEIIKRHRTWLEPTLIDLASGLLVFAFHSTVLKTPRATILVDTCSGNDKERPHKPRYHRKNWPYLVNLAAAGFAPEDIDYVLCTHLHADHVGWNTRLLDGRWAPTFPNARYLFAREEWEHWRVAELRARYTTDPYYEDSLLPVIERGHAEFVAPDYAFEDSVWIEPRPGAHTRSRLCRGAVSASIRSPEWRHHAHGIAVRRAVGSTAAFASTRKRRERHGDASLRPSPIALS